MMVKTIFFGSVYPLAEHLAGDDLTLTLFTVWESLPSVPFPHSRHKCSGRIETKNIRFPSDITTETTTLRFGDALNRRSLDIHPKESGVPVWFPLPP